MRGKWAEAWVERHCPEHPGGGFEAADARHLESLRRLSDPRRFGPAQLDGAECR